MERKETPQDIIANEIGGNISIDGLKAFYESFVIPFLKSDTGKNFQEKNTFLFLKLKNSRREAGHELIGTILGDREYFLQFYHSLPKDLQIIIYQLVWFRSQSVKHLEAEFSLNIRVNEKEMYFSKIHSKYLFLSIKIIPCI